MVKRSSHERSIRFTTCSGASSNCKTMETTGNWTSHEVLFVHTDNTNASLDAGSSSLPRRTTSTGELWAQRSLASVYEQKATAYSENKYSKEIYSVNTSGTENHRSNEYKRFKISIFAISATALSAVVFFSVATSTNAWMIIPPSDPVTPSANQYGLYEGCYADTSGQEECGTIAVSCMIDCAHSIIPHICDKYEPVMSCDSFFAIRIVVVLVGALVLISPIAMLVTSGMGHQPKRVATTTICFYGLGIILSILAIFMFVFTEYEPHKKKLAAIDTKPHDSPHREISMGFSFWCMLGSIACQMITWGTMVYVVLHEYNLYRLHEKRSAAMIVDHVVLEGD